MKKIVATLIALFFIGLAGVSQTEKIVLCVAPLRKSAGIEDKYIKIMENLVYDQAMDIKGLNVIAKTPYDLQKIFTEWEMERGSRLAFYSETIGDTVNRIGATHLVTGEITTVSVKKALIRAKMMFGYMTPIYGKIVNIVMNLQVVNVSTGQVEFSKQITSDIKPDAMLLSSDEKVINNKIRAMGKDISAFLKAWYDENIITKQF